MKVEECFGLDEDEYSTRMGRCSIYELRKREVKKTRQFYTYSFSCVSSGLAAFHTAGMSLILGAFCCLRANVAQQKLKIVQKVVVERGYTPYERQMEDCCIPFGIVTCGFCVSWGVHAFVAEHLMSEVPVPAGIPTGESAIPVIVEHPVSAASGFVHAFENQAADLAHAATVHSHSATQSYVQLPASVPYSAGGQEGYATGVQLAPSADSAGASYLASSVGESSVSKLEKNKYPEPIRQRRR